ncbi:hypothetical protein CYLTODRAFT_491609 [Cylindrobasidium torrendii FP15055 ss-10]|uniref:Uncharacterized protein n=1 Tax=Cylindrobasidium torrendii FP15055 ss-10 TaxID=1314674 RepID=A0A0D7B815_9AGAR|nr:hypothetical protein CYLTODRAFT_491609 [Cylindrobasidium torrendii FP15055 ss-10]
MDSHDLDDTEEKSDPKPRNLRMKSAARKTHAFVDYEFLSSPSESESESSSQGSDYGSSDEDAGMDISPVDLASPAHLPENPDSYPELRDVSMDSPPGDRSMECIDPPIVSISQEPPLPPAARHLRWEKSSPGPSTTREASLPANAFAALRVASEPLPASRSWTPVPDSQESAQHISGPTRYRPVTPPPQSNPHGPAARPPYIPSDRGPGAHTYLARRADGRRIYDLLGALPLTEFGTMAHDVLETELMIFETESLKPLRDEDKVMCALWARWVKLHRDVFLKNHFDGATAFVEKYWKTIHYAAGFGALRYWFITMMVRNTHGNKPYLSAQELAQVLMRYQELVGMKDWYT